MDENKQKMWVFNRIRFSLHFLLKLANIAEKRAAWIWQNCSTGPVISVCKISTSGKSNTTQTLRVAIGKAGVMAPFPISLRNSPFN